MLTSNRRTSRCLLGCQQEVDQLAVSSRALKKAATRQALVDAAARLFAERGVEGTTMDDIARAAGTSRTSVFNYFGYKEMILCEIGARYVAEVAGTERASRSRSPRRRLQDMVDTLAAIALRDPQLVAAVARELTHPDPARRSPRQRDSYSRMGLDLVTGTLVRAGGDYPLEDVRAELHRAVDLYLDGAIKPGS